MASSRICVVGSLNMDLVVQTPELPRPGQTILGGPFATFPGGKGANQAVAAARAGAAVSMIGCLGDDSNGEILRQGLQSEGIAAQQVRRRAGVASGVALIAVAPDGQNTIIVAAGANGTLTAADVEESAAAIGEAKVLVMQLEVPLPAIARAASIARAAGTLVVLNPAPAQPLPAELLADIDILIPNETETAMLTGVLPTDWPSAAEAARRLGEQGPRSIVLTLGSRGALLLQQGRIYRQPACSVAAVDATAAGDAFVGCFAVALAEGLSAPEALRWATVAGALSTTRSGAQPSLPTRAEIEALLPQVPPLEQEPA